jgi:hypothetical protein
MTLLTKPIVALASIMAMGCALASPLAEFSVQPIPDAVFARMLGKSYPKDCKVPRSDLRYLRITHIGFDGKPRTGEMVVNRRIADEVLEIFKKLYAARYPIERIQLIDDFDANDERAMTANNTSSFCYRTISGTNTISKHGYGIAVDLNTLYNPYVVPKKGNMVRVEPAAGWPYIDRAAPNPYRIDTNDLAYKLFTERGFIWGGSWKNRKDYQHFEKPASILIQKP